MSCRDSLSLQAFLGYASLEQTGKRARMLRRRALEFRFTRWTRASRYCRGRGAELSTEPCVGVLLVVG